MFDAIFKGQSISFSVYEELQLNDVKQDFFYSNSHVISVAVEVFKTKVSWTT